MSGGATIPRERPQSCKGPAGRSGARPHSTLQRPQSCKGRASQSRQPATGQLVRPAGGGGGRLPPRASQLDVEPAAWEFDLDLLLDEAADDNVLGSTANAELIGQPPPAFGEWDLDGDLSDVPRLKPFSQRNMQSAKVRGSREHGRQPGAGMAHGHAAAGSSQQPPHTDMRRSRDAMAAFAVRASHLVKPMPSGLNGLGAPHEYDESLLRTHELEVERLRETAEVLRRLCDDERAGRTAAQKEIRRLRTEQAAAGGADALRGQAESKLVKRVRSLENTLDLTKSKLSEARAAHKRAVSEVADLRRDNACLERVCKQLQTGAKSTDAEKVELARQLRGTQQAKAGLSARLAQVLPAFSEARQRWGEEKRLLTRHVEHYRKAALIQRHPGGGSGLQQEPDEYELELDGPMADDLAEPPPTSSHHHQQPEAGPPPPPPVPPVADGPNYAVMAYINQLAEENGKLKRQLFNAFSAQAGTTAAAPPQTNRSSTERFLAAAAGGAGEAAGAAFDALQQAGLQRSWLEPLHSAKEQEPRLQQHVEVEQAEQERHEEEADEEELACDGEAGMWSDHAGAEEEAVDRELQKLDAEVLEQQALKRAEEEEEIAASSHSKRTEESDQEWLANARLRLAGTASPEQQKEQEPLAAQQAVDPRRRLLPARTQAYPAEAYPAEESAAGASASTPPAAAAETVDPASPLGLAVTTGPWGATPTVQPAGRAAATDQVAEVVAGGAQPLWGMPFEDSEVEETESSFGHSSAFSDCSGHSSSAASTSTSLPAGATAFNFGGAVTPSEVAEVAEESAAATGGVEDDAASIVSSASGRANSRSSAAERAPTPAPTVEGIAGSLALGSFAGAMQAAEKAAVMSVAAEMQQAAAAAAPWLESSSSPRLQSSVAVLDSKMDVLQAKLDALPPASPPSMDEMHSLLRAQLISSAEFRSMASMASSSPAAVAAAAAPAAAAPPVDELSALSARLDAAAAAAMDSGRTPPPSQHGGRHQIAGGEHPALAVRSSSPSPPVSAPMTPALGSPTDDRPANTDLFHSNPGPDATGAPNKLVRPAGAIPGMGRKRGAARSSGGRTVL